ncbi:nuclear fragile X mental retardation-interacting protein 2 [Rana temporaria]|uniref:nuclear fragile X mental retardation-interacting protein 2 n=1 Tax=Rana temporaria TaxID=8407 RepID=UPI001AAD6940|nr:nuclear fragile X mental retardation-interacting protein 2 [Rana temporaria]
MEEQPGHHHHHHHHLHHSSSSHGTYYYYSTPSLQHGAEGNLRYQPKPLKHDHKHALQHQEAHQKKTGHGEINGTTGDRHNPTRILGSEKSANQTASSVTNGSQQTTADLNTNSRHLAKTINFGKTSNKTKTLLQKNSMDKKNDKTYESKPKDIKCTEKVEAGLIQNGLLSNNSGFITNGYVSKGAENDGSGSESGYATPKKRKAKCTNAKPAENSNLLTGKMSDPEFKLDSDNLKSDGFAEQKGGSRLDNGKASWKCESGTGRGKPNSGDLQRKNSDAKPIAGKKFDDRPKGKASPVTSSKEDSWTLFKPPPVFPVDNSSAKIVPKISYASKVKENLNKAAQNNSVSHSSLTFSSQAGETPPSNCVSQVPMSAMKSVSTVNFANGPLLVGADGGFMAAAASTVSHTLPGGAEPSSTESSPASSNPPDQKKSGLFTFSSNMQHALPEVVQGESSGLSNQHSLGEIFQNQWGLSFINEPSAGPEAGTDKKEVGPMVWENSTPQVSQGAEIVSSGNECPVFPKAYELEKRTSPQVPDGATLKAAHGSGGDGTVLSLEPQHLGELQKPEAASQGSLVFQSKVLEIELTLPTSLKNTLQTSAKDKRYHGDLDCKDSWGSFDLRAAIIYHTKEMESIFNLQKQDPNRIITYNEAMDHPDL